MAIAGTGKSGSGTKIDPGDKHGAMSNSKCEVSIKEESPPSVGGESSGVVKHNRSGNKSENLNGMPTVH